MPVRSRWLQCGCLALLAGLFVLIPLHESMSQDQPTPPARPPAEDAPARLTLTGDDARQVELLEREMAELASSGKFAEAQEPARKILAIRTRVQGVDHWQTVDSERQVRTLAQVAASSPEAREEFASLYRIVAVADDLMQRAQYAEAEPLYRKAMAICEQVLGEDHPDTARSYNNLAGNLNAQGKYAEAESLFLKVVVINEKVLGKVHPGMVRSYNNLGLYYFYRGRYAEAEPLLHKVLAIREKALGEGHLDTVGSIHNLAANLDAQGKYAEAELLHRKIVTIHEKVLSVNHADTAGSYNELALNLTKQGKYTEAEPLFHKALAIREKVLGVDHPDTANSYNSVAGNLNAQCKYAEAEPLFYKALAIREKVLGVDHLNTANSYNNLAGNLNAQGKYAEAELLHRKALAIWEKVLGEDHPETATGYSSLAGNLDEQGKYAEAESLIRKALAIHEKVLGVDHPDTASSYINLAFNLGAQGKYAWAEPFYRKALAIHEKVLGEDHPNTATSYISLAFNLDHQGKYAEAEPLLRKAVAILERMLGEDHSNTATSYNNLGVNLYAQGKYAEAEAVWIRAARSFEAARRLISHTGLERAAFAAERSPLRALAMILARRGAAASAWQRLEADLARGLFDDLARPLKSDERRREQDLLARLQRLDEQIVALSPIPSGDKVRHEQAEALRQRREALKVEWAEFEAGVERKYGAAAGRPYDLKRIQGHIPPDAALVAWLDVSFRFNAVDPRSEHWACIVRRHGAPTWIKLTGSEPQGQWTEADERLPAQVVDAFTPQPDDPMTEWRGPAGRLAAQRLAPLVPHLGATGHLPAVRHLIVLTSRWMAGVPVEALNEAQPEDAPRYTVSYAPSGTMFAWLQERRPKDRGHESEPPRLLVLGDPIFQGPASPPAPTPPDHGVLVVAVISDSNVAQSGIEPGDVLLRYGETEVADWADLAEMIRERDKQTSDPARDRVDLSARAGIPVTVWREGRSLKLTLSPGSLVFSAKPAAEAVLARRETEARIARSRGPELRRLVWSRPEVEAIQGLFADSLVLEREKASEQELDWLAIRNELRRFGVLHLSTHGRMEPRIAMQSRLYLSRDGLPDAAARVRAGQEVYDGELTAEQILRTWHLDAELVTLSACQTALGQPGGGEGYLGFSQALFLAGARSVVLSLWEVDDRASALLMVRFYQNWLGKRPGLDRPMSKAEALREAKEWLRELTFEQADAETRKLPGGEGIDETQRSERSERPRAGAAAKEIPSARPFAHPHYWAGFILIGDPN
jgi:tetratricopeptide (TPR) repeat protein